MSWYENIGGPTSFLFSGVKHEVASNASAPVTVAWSDFDGDGDRDAVVAWPTLGTITLHRNADSATPHGRFPPQPGTAVVVGVVGVAAVVAADVNRNGATDVVYAVNSGGDAQVLWLESAWGGVPGVWPSPFAIAPHVVATLTGWTAACTAVGDVDGDGDVDVVVCGGRCAPWSSGISTFFSILIFCFRAAVDCAPSHRPLLLCACTLILSHSRSWCCGCHVERSLLSWVDNNGAGDFNPIPRPISTSLVDCAGVTLTDVDGDGDVDVGVVSVGEHAALWFENIFTVGNEWVPLSGTPAVGSGFATGARVVWGGDANATSVTFGDLDGDGDSDAVLASTQDNGLSWIENTGPGLATSLFSLRVNTVSGSAEGASSLAKGDIDGYGCSWTIAALQWLGCIANWCSPALACAPFPIQH